MMRRSGSRAVPRTTALRAIKLAHTIVWAFFASCIVALLVEAWRGNLSRALVLAAIISVEVLVLTANHMSCPLTGVAARYTDDRRANFDIYLPLWLARYNKVIFGSLFFAGVLLLLVRWREWGW